MEEVTLEWALKCETCEFKDQAQYGDWCYLHVNSPIRDCKEFTLKRSIKENMALNALYKQCPDLNDEWR